MFSRPRLQVSPIAVALLGLTVVASAQLAQARDHRERTAKNVILVIGDGMQLEHEIATSRYLYGHDSRLTFHAAPVQANVTTWDVTTYNFWADSLGVPRFDASAVNPTVGYDPSRGGRRPYPQQRRGIDDAYFLAGKATDSASAATAWATGYKTDEGNIAWLPGDPPGGSLETIAEIFRRSKGAAMGVVSTVPFTHATPAAHVSHNVNRNSYHAIADEILNVTQPEVVIGGGHPLWARDKTGTNGAYMSMSLYEAVKGGAHPDYVFVERQTGVDGAESLLQGAQAAATEGKKLFGLFGGSAGNFESPVPKDLPGTPLVTRATVENPLLRDASLAALKVLSKDEDGFFLMVEQGDIDWANHANDFSRMVGTTWDLHEAVLGIIAYVEQPHDDIDWNNTLLIVTADHANSYTRLAKPLGAGDLPTQVGTCATSGLCTYPDGDVTYGSPNHTNELVRFYALGTGARLTQQYTGAWYPGMGILDNTQIFHIMTEAAGIPQPAHVSIVH